MSRRRRSRSPLLITIAIIAACTRSPSTPRMGTSRAPISNITRSDYVGSTRCGHCHAAIAGRFARSPMHQMTRVPEATSVVAPFDGGSLQYKDDTARMTSDHGARFVSIESKRFGDKKYRVTRVIGGHHREDFAGIEVGSASAEAKPIGDAHDELILPVSWVFANKAYRYKGYSVMSKERPGLRAGGVWNRTCIFCHNTVPWLSTALGGITRVAGGKPVGFQGELVDDHLPVAMRWPIEINDPAALRSAIGAELRRLEPSEKLAAELPRALEQTVVATRKHFGASDLIELGIGCESCHGGGREHAEDPSIAPSDLPTSPLLHVGAPKPSSSASRAQAINRTCARCHQVTFSGYPWSWEGARRDDFTGGSHINSGEARDFLLGGCASAMSCVSCHDPHGDDGRARMRSLQGEPGDRVCLSCHSRYSGDVARAAHTHHAKGSAGDRCIACHMPKKNMNLDGGLGRYHRIGSSNDPKRVEQDRPLECALCHGEKTVGVLVDRMEQWWHKRYDRTRIAALYGGSLDVDPMLTTLRLGKPHEEAVAMTLLGEGKRSDASALIAERLIHPIGLLRWYAADALGKIVGARPPVDLHADDKEIAAAASAWLTGPATKASAAP